MMTANSYLPPDIVTYEDVVKLDAKTLLVDVREPAEIAQTGALPKAINIPMSDLVHDLVKLTQSEFANKFNGRNKPSMKDPIVFSCKSGARALKAATEMKRLGFEKAKCYKGSWLEWEQRSKMN